jgi:hypothetical protein
MTLTSFIITAIFVLLGMEEGRKIFYLLLRKLLKGNFYAGITTLQTLFFMLAAGLTVETLNLLERFPNSFVCQILLLLLPNIFISLFIIAVVPTVFLLIYGLVFSYTFLEGLTARERVNRVQTDDLKAHQEHPCFKEVYTKLYIQITFIFLEKYDHVYVISSLNRDLRELIILCVMAQLLRTQTMEELAQTSEAEWDRKKLSELLFQQGFRENRWSLGLHTNRHFARLSTIVQHNHLSISLIRVRKKIDRLKPKGS